MQSLHGKIKALRSVSRGAGILYAKGLEAVKAGHENDGYTEGYSSTIVKSSDGGGMGDRFDKRTWLMGR